MAQTPEFPAVSFHNLSQSATEIQGVVALDNTRQVRNAQAICENFCPHFNSTGSIGCNGIGEEGNAVVRVKRSQSRIAWVRMRVARAFNAPCKVTYDGILKTRIRGER